VTEIVVKKDKAVEVGPLTVALLDEAAERLLEISQLLMRPKGFIYPINVLVEAETRVLDFIKFYPHTPLFSVALYNDGPDEVYPSVNVEQKDTPLKAGENLTLEFHSPRIMRLYLTVVGSGKKAKIRGFGLY
jgi:hypothetical protein